MASLEVAGGRVASGVAGATHGRRALHVAVAAGETATVSLGPPPWPAPDAVAPGGLVLDLSLVSGGPARVTVRLDDGAGRSRSASTSVGPGRPARVAVPLRGALPPRLLLPEARQDRFVNALVVPCIRRTPQGRPAWRGGRRRALCWIWRRLPPRGRNGPVDRSAVRREVGLFEGLAGALTGSP